MNCSLISEQALLACSRSPAPTCASTPRGARRSGAVRHRAPVATLPSQPASSADAFSLALTCSSSPVQPKAPRAASSAIPILAEGDPAEQLSPASLLAPHGSPSAAASVLAPPQEAAGVREANGIAVLNGSAAGHSADTVLASQGQEGLGITEFLRGKNVLITGATGFLAKVLVEKILREQPQVGSLYLVIQPRSDATPEQRLASQVNGSQIFERLRAEHGGEYADFMARRLVAVEGNLCKEGLGIPLQQAEELRGKVDVIINSAATTTFDERYDYALNLNTLGPKRIMEFARSCPNLKMLVHVSTAFVNGYREGWTAERPFEDGVSIAEELRGPEAVAEALSVEGELALAQRELETAQARAPGGAMEGGYSTSGEEAAAAAMQRHMVDLGMRRAQQFGWQDTYVFTKAMGEMLVGRAAQDCPFPVAILRPSIVESSATEPLRGWMEGLRMADPILLAYGKGQVSGFLADPSAALDVVPADFVINALLAVLAKGVQRPAGSLEVYHVATSVANPLTMQLTADATSDHFARDPMIVPREGKPIKVERMRVFRHPYLFAVDVWLKYQLPLQIARLLPKRKGSLSEKRTNVMLKTAERLSYLAKIYAPYTFYACRFDASNTQSLLKEMSKEELQQYPFDLTSIDWHEYLCDIHLPGLRKYVLKGRGSRDGGL